MISTKTRRNYENQFKTPKYILDEISGFYNGHIDLDPCIPIYSDSKEKYAQVEFNVLDDGLDRDWTKYRTIFLNPPYSLILPWVEKSLNTIDQGDDNTILILLPSPSSVCKWSNLLFPEIMSLVYFNHTIHFNISPNRSFVNVLVLLSNKKEKEALMAWFKQCFTKFGTVLNGR
ncbi:MAG: hypothetical protein HQL54_05445 [Magnetococcales bacterium]|nr:hypothetical protein [Magnetococcales bacterium]